jgi:hypothetical protein
MRWQALGLLEQSLQADPEGGMAVLRALQADPPIGLALLRLALRGVSPDSTEVLPAVAAPPEAQAGAGESGSPTPDAQPGEWAAPAPAARGGETSTLRAALQAGDAAGQAAAFDAVAAQDPDTALRELVASLRDPTNPGRWQALQLLDQTLVGEDATVRTALIDTLQDPDPMLRESALQALARRAEPEGMGAVLQAFSDSDAATRVAVIDAIGPTEAGRQFLRGALSDADETVRTAAAARLREAEAAGQSD